MQTLTVKSTDKFLKDYYTVLGQMGQLYIDHEMAVRSAFQNVLTGYSRKLDWTVVPEYPVPGHKNLRIDAALLDFWKQRRGFWEVKGEHDDLERKHVYAILHHPEYRERYAANLKRELPRIPFVGVNGIQPGTCHPEHRPRFLRPEPKDLLFLPAIPLPWKRIPLLTARL